LALIDSNVTAVVAVAISLLLEGFAVVVVITLVRLARNSARHRRQRTPPAIPAP
jgi:Flp pilus assembly protein TadB